MTDKERIDSLFKKTSDYADEIMKLKQENNALKERVAELENASKKKRKFRAMTNSEFCTKWLLKHKFCKHLDGHCCPLALSKACFKDNDIQPCKVNGKYIFIEVKE